jgi:hypothetical protein
MYLTNDQQLGGNTMAGRPEDLSFIVKYNWPSPKHMKEAIKVLLSARLDGSQKDGSARFDEEVEEKADVYFALAKNPETSEEVLIYLGKIGDERICEYVAFNSHSPEATLISLAAHHSATVRASLSENPCCPITVLYSLSKDEHPDVRFRLAENPNLPDSILQELCQDENPFVAMQANKTLRKLSGGTVVSGQFASQQAKMRAVQG